MTSWRYKLDSQLYGTCSGLDLGSGVLLWKDPQQPIAYFDSIKFRSYCDESRPVYSSFRKTENSFEYLDEIAADWAIFMSDKNENGQYKYSIYAITLSFTANFVITLFLTVIVFVAIRKKPYKGASNLLKLGSTLASVNLTIFVVKALKSLRDNHMDRGVVSTENVLRLLWNDLTFTSIDFIVVLICELCQVQIIMRLFSRVQEKRMIFFIGMLLSIISQILWAIPTFSQSVHYSYMGLQYDGEGLTLLSPFVYLFRISLAASYASIICSHIFTKRHLCFQDKHMIILTLVTCVIVLLQPGFFVADVANIWIDDLSEIFNTTCYVGSTVIVWEWVDHVLILERKMQAQSVLGRPIYEDEQQDYYFANYALRVQEAISSNEDDDAPESPVQTNFNYKKETVSNAQNNKVEFNEPQRMKDVVLEKCSNILDGMLYFTDHFIVKGLMIKTLSLHSRSSDDRKKSKTKVRRRIGLERPNEVYVYAMKDVVFDSDEEQENPNMKTREDVESV